MKSVGDLLGESKFSEIPVGDLTRDLSKTGGIQKKGGKEGVYRGMSMTSKPQSSEWGVDSISEEFSSEIFGQDMQGKANLMANEIIPTPKKAPEVLKLEKILGESYEKPVCITNITEHPISRKEVKEVHFVFENQSDFLHKLWIFKADPKETAKELAAYQIAFDHNVPTGRPIAFKPEPGMQKYPYDIAILGGIVEHAGDSYDTLIGNLRLHPQYMHKSAIAVAKLIADAHVKLTKCAPDFEEYGIELHTVDPENEIMERFVPGKGIDPEDAYALVKACRQLSNEQHSNLILSHNDLHTKNLVALTHGNAMTTRKFGIIDWGSIGFGHIYSDPVDFWTHHERKASEFMEYLYRFTDLKRAYDAQFKETAAALDLELPRFSATDALIQTALWNVYEMYDPLRKDPRDIEDKAIKHYFATMDALDKLSNSRAEASAKSLQQELYLLSQI